jgi:molecular chaperone GrpE
MTDEAEPVSDAETPVNDDGAGPAAQEGPDVEALQAEIAGLKEQLLRYAADGENLRRRTEREVNDARAYAIQKFAKDLFGVSDNLGRALQSMPREGLEGAIKNLVLGIEMTEKELAGAFERNGVKRVDPARGDRFDPHQHQAMMEQDAPDIAPGAVIQVLAPGYELFGRVVRPAMVVVASKSSGKTEAMSAANPYAQGDADPSGASVDRKA